MNQNDHYDDISESGYGSDENEENYSDSQDHTVNTVNTVNCKCTAAVE